MVQPSRNTLATRALLRCDVRDSQSSMGFVDRCLRALPRESAVAPGGRQYHPAAVEWHGTTTRCAKNDCWFGETGCRSLDCLPGLLLPAHFSAVASVLDSLLHR